MCDFVKLNRKQVLQELNAEELSNNIGSDGQKIQSKSRIVQQSVGIIGWNARNNILSLRSRSESRGFNHKMRIMFDGANELRSQISSGKFNSSDPVALRSALQKVIRGDIKVHCDCESFQFYRSYQITQLGAAIIPEPRPPKRNDPNLERSHLCHHLLAGLRYLMKFEQHIIEFIMTQDSMFKPQTTPDGDGGIEASIAKQLGSVVDTWSESMGEALNNPELGRTLANGVKDILRKRRLRVEQVLQEAIDYDKLRLNIEDFAEYIVDNFVPKEDRVEVFQELIDFINRTVGEPTEEGEEEMTDNKLGGVDLEEIRKRARVYAKNIVAELFNEESPDDVNGPDPSAMNPGEEVLVPAIKEYCNQTGKQMYEDDFKEMIIGLVRAIDTTDKIAQFKKMVGSFANIEAVTRFEEPNEPDMESSEFGDEGSDDFDFESDTVDEDVPVNDEDLGAVDDLETGEEKMQDKKEELEA